MKSLSLARYRFRKWNEKKENGTVAVIGSNIERRLTIVLRLGSSWANHACPRVSLAGFLKAIEEVNKHGGE